MKLAQPSGVADISFACSQVLGVTCVDQDDLEPSLLQNLLDRDSIDPRRFHRDTDYVVRFEPIRQFVQVLRECAKRRTGVSVHPGSTAAMCF